VYIRNFDCEEESAQQFYTICHLQSTKPSHQKSHPQSNSSTLSFLATYISNTKARASHASNQEEARTPALVQNVPVKDEPKQSQGVHYLLKKKQRAKKLSRSIIIQFRS